MGFFEDIGKKVADVGQKTVQKTKEMSDILRLESLVTKEENKLEQIYSQIGKMYVELHTDSFEDALLTKDRIQSQLCSADRTKSLFCCIGRRLQLRNWLPAGCAENSSAWP